MTPLPSIHWHYFDNDGNELPIEEHCWWLTFEAGNGYIDMQLFADGKVEWFARNRGTGEYEGNAMPEPASEVFRDPRFGAAMALIKGEYDNALGTAKERG